MSNNMLQSPALERGRSPFVDEMIETLSASQSS